MIVLFGMQERSGKGAKTRLARIRGYRMHSDHCNVIEGGDVGSLLPDGWPTCSSGHDKRKIV
jgi:hypothetical protein